MSLALQNTRTEHLKEDYLDILETNTEISKIPFQGHEIPMDKFNKIYKTCTIKTTKKLLRKTDKDVKGKIVFMNWKTQYC